MYWSRSRTAEDSGTITAPSLTTRWATTPLPLIMPGLHVHLSLIISAMQASLASFRAVKPDISREAHSTEETLPWREQTTADSCAEPAL